MKNENGKYIKVFTKINLSGIYSKYFKLPQSQNLDINFKLHEHKFNLRKENSFTK